MSAPEEIREIVRRRYADAATRSATGDHEGAVVVEASCCGAAPTATTDLPAAAAETSCCGTAPVDLTDTHGRILFGAELYGAEAQGAPDDAVAASLGCGVPTAVADLHPGEVVLDLGSGAGADVLISARRVAPGGRAIGLDMTDEMLALAAANAAQAGITNVEWLKGHIESIPLPGNTIDVVISNCVVNLAADKPAVFREIARVLRPGGRIGISDVVADDSLTPEQRLERGSYAGCIAGALSFTEFRSGLEAVGMTDVSLTISHAVADRMYSVIVKAAKPGEPVGAVAATAAGAAAAAKPADDPRLEPVTFGECCG